MISYIDIQKLYPHPSNPRKDLGDLNELAESIKANGILQNLTVVPLEAKGEQYRVVIGHRRCAAAVKAGLEEVPCVVANMDEKTQVATMLLENIQRNDLTVYEQAQGFQMMLDLGDTAQDIGEKTGFSKTTIQRRIKLLTLDREKFRKSVERGATLMDFAELDKIKSPKLKNKVLEAIGTNDFKWKLRQVLEDEAMSLRKKELIKLLKDWARPIEQQDKNMSYEHYFWNYKYEDFIKPKDADNSEYFYVDKGSSITLYKKNDEPEKKKKSPAEKAFTKRENQLKNLAKRAYKLRYDFVREFNSCKKHHKAIMELAVNGLMSYGRGEPDDVLKILGIEKPKFDEDITYDEKNKIIDDLIDEQFEASPERVLFIATYCKFGDCPSNRYYQSRSWKLTHKYKSNSQLDKVYDALIALGYKMSDEERSLQDGTHELYISDTD